MKPIVQAFLLADHVYQDKHTGKVIIAGCFNQFLRIVQQDDKDGEASRDPPRGISLHHVGVQAGSPYAYLNLVSLKRERIFELRWVKLSDNRVYFVIGIKIKPNDDPLIAAEAIVPLPPLKFEEEGGYALELLADDEPLAMWRVNYKIPGQEEMR